MHFNQSRHPWVQKMGVAFALLAGLHAHAQGMSNPVAQAVSTELVLARYQSALAGYQRHEDPGIASWAKSNQTVQAIGGWKAYAREPSVPTLDGKRPAPPNNPMPMGHAHGEHQ